MSKELICHRCGVHLSPDEQPIDPAKTVEVVIPATMSLSDHPLGEPPEPDFLRTIPNTEAGSERPPALGPNPIPGAPTEDVAFPTPLNEPAVVEMRAGLPEPEARIATAGEPRFPVLTTEAPVNTALSSPSPQVAAVEEVEASSGPGMLVVLLASYASAMTLACGWLLWQAKHRDMSTGPDTLPADSRPDDRSSKLTPIATDHTTTLGKPLRIGDLELTPIRARLGRVTLESQTSEGRPQRKPGAGESILMTLRIKNLSHDKTFAPIEDAFIRTPDRGAPDSFIETSEGTLDLYPLALSSEWRIVGQENRPLKPGESIETLLASAPDSAGTATGIIRLRLKLHPNAASSTVIHIDFNGDAIQ